MSDEAPNRRAKPWGMIVAAFVVTELAVIAAFPIFYLIGRFMRRYARLAHFAALAVVVVNLVIDSLIILSATGKLGGAYLGSRIEITP